MPASSSRSAPPHLRTPPREVRVTNWALRDDPWRSIPMVLLGLGAAVVAGIASQSAMTCGVAALAIGAALWRTWLPIVYEFDPRGVTQIVFGRRRAVSWLAVGDYEFTPRGVLLYPQGDPTWWGAARALFILWSGQREAIVQMVEYYVGGRLLIEDNSSSRPA